jgi:hypothetical protein
MIMFAAESVAPPGLWIFRPAGAMDVSIIWGVHHYGLQHAQPQRGETSLGSDVNSKNIVAVARKPQRGETSIGE